MTVKSIGVGEFKARCLALLEEVRARKTRLLITRRGRPIAQVMPCAKSIASDKGLLGTILREDDIVSPTGEVWSANR